MDKVLLSLLYEDTARRHPPANQEENSSGAERAGTSILDFSVYKTTRNKCLSFKPFSLRSFVRAAQADEDTSFLNISFWQMLLVGQLHAHPCLLLLTKILAAFEASFVVRCSHVTQI